MDLFEKTEEYEAARKLAGRLKENLISDLEKTILYLPYEVNELDRKYLWYIGCKNYFEPPKLYYPILDTPKGFIKKDKEIYIIHDGYFELKDGKIWITSPEGEWNEKFITNKYTLIDGEGRTIIIKEYANLRKTKLNYGYAYVPCNNILFHIDIFGNEYNLFRTMNQGYYGTVNEYEQFLDKIAKKYDLEITGFENY